MVLGSQLSGALSADTQSDSVDSRHRPDEVEARTAVGAIDGHVVRTRPVSAFRTRPPVLDRRQQHSLGGTQPASGVNVSPYSIAYRSTLGLDQFPRTGSDQPAQPWRYTTGFRCQRIALLQYSSTLRLDKFPQTGLDYTDVNITAFEVHNLIPATTYHPTVLHTVAPWDSTNSRKPDSITRPRQTPTAQP